MFKKLFYASASIMMLALAYHLGATRAAAQTTPSAMGVAFDPSTSSFTAVENSTFWYSAPLTQTTMTLPGVPAGLIAGTGISGTVAYVVDYGGTIYARSFGGGTQFPSWAIIGYITGGGPSPATRPTFGQLKAQYRK